MSQAEASLRNQLGAGGKPMGRFSAVQVLAALGTTKDNAALITVPSDGLVTVTGADTAKGVKLPPPVADGHRVNMKNHAAATLKVYPHASSFINTAGADVALVVVAAGSGTFIWDAVSARWWTIPGVPTAAAFDAREYEELRKEEERKKEEEAKREADKKLPDNRQPVPSGPGPAPIEKASPAAVPVAHAAPVAHKK